jgi:hypothetical protein
MTVSDLLEQPCNTSDNINKVLQVVNSLFQTCWQLGTSPNLLTTWDKQCEYNLLADLLQDVRCVYLLTRLATRCESCTARTHVKTHKLRNTNVTRLTTQGYNNIVISWLFRICWNNLATSLIMPSSLLQVVTSLFQTCWQLGTTSSAHTTCWRPVGRLATRW